MEGYIKLFRMILHSKVFDNPKLLKIWIWCMCKASYKEHDQLVGRQTQHLLPGQFVFGRKAASEELKMPESTVYDYMKLLEKMNSINIKPNSKYSVVTLKNWAVYQSMISEDQQKIQQQIDSKWTKNGHEKDTNNNSNKGENEKNSYSLNRDEIRKRSEEVLTEMGLDSRGNPIKN